MMSRTLPVLTLLAAAAVSGAQITTIDFESVPSADPHPNGTMIQGVSFNNLSTNYGYWNADTGMYRTHSGKGLAFFTYSPIVGTLLNGPSTDFSVWYSASDSASYVELFLNGVSVASVTGLAANADNPAAQVSIPGIAFDSFVLGGNNNYVAYDDISFGTQAVPEPASMAALGLGGLALLRRRRKG